MARLLLPFIPMPVGNQSQIIRDRRSRCQNAASIGTQILKVTDKMIPKRSPVYRQEMHAKAVESGDLLWLIQRNNSKQWRK